MLNICIILFCTIFMFSPSVYGFYPSKRQLNKFAVSKQWLNLYQYKKSFFAKSGFKSLSSERKFFFSRIGQDDPVRELTAAIAAFNDSSKLWGKVRLSSQCAYPARFEVLKRRWPKLFKKDQWCKNFNKWIKKISADGLYMVYAEPYPNNPASMFGHSFLRFNNIKQPRTKDYVVGFQASVDPGDNPITYSLKGIWGGYKGFYKLKPYYINLGLYNNNESRGLWEYKINFTKNEINFLLKVLWEQTFNTGFNYYFFTQNCSYFMLTLLETVRPTLQLTNSFNTFVYPLETVKVALSNKPNQSFIYRPPIKKIINKRYKLMSSQQKSMFKKAVANVKYVSTLRDAFVLDGIIDYWQYKKYQKNSRLSSAQKRLKNTASNTRAKIKKKTYPLKAYTKVSPILAHKPSKISLSASKVSRVNHYNLSMLFGYHGLNDSEDGITRFAFIEYLGLGLTYFDKSIKLDHLTIVDLASLENFNLLFKSLSWAVRLKGSRNCYFCKGKLKFTPEFSLGPSISSKNYVAWSFLTLRSVIDFHHQNIFPKINFGLKFKAYKFSFATLSDLFLKSKKIIFDFEQLISLHFTANKTAFLKFHLRPIDKFKTFLIGFKFNY
ncbi:MAG: DUF4105 domain-containing protein [Bacteriovoracaceae bacterium]|nr:DUF4105 domain-containing protein [Bacteriovoracaceae bacterium]